MQQTESEILLPSHALRFYFRHRANIFPPILVLRAEFLNSFTRKSEEDEIKQEEKEVGLLKTAESLNLS